MEAPALSWRQRRTLGAFVSRFPVVHLGIGILGNALFILGTVLFLARQQDVGIWVFLVGSCGMFLGSVGEALRILGKRRLWRFDVDPRSPGESWSETGRASSPLD